MSTEESTRERVLDLIVSEGPVAVADLADSLHLTPAGIRRHLTHLVGGGYVVEHEIPGRRERGRGRPARCYVATPEGQKALSSAYSSVAVQALGFLRKAGGLEEFVAEEARKLERALGERIDPSAPLTDRVDALAAALSERGYAASARSLPGGFALQLCQGHCPVLAVAEAVPEWCEAETRALSHALGVHVQRLSTLAGGAHVCTTNIPLAMAGGNQT
jgi:predicted ArsR family transcriptional regulator